MKFSRLKNDDFLKWSVIIIIVIILIAFGKKLLGLLKNAFSLVGVGKSQEEEQAGVVANEIKNEVQNNLPHSIWVYRNIAEGQYNQMNTSHPLGLGFDIDNLIAPLQNLTSDELVTVFAEFGSRNDHVFGLPVVTGDLFSFYRNNLRSWSVYGKSDLDKMREIWDKTPLKL